MLNKITIEDFHRFNGKNVRITYKYFFGGKSHREGRLEVEEYWAYLYDEGKSGSDYNGAFELKHGLNEIISIELME